MPICVQEGTMDDSSLMTVDPEELRRRKTAHMKGGISKQELIAASIYLRALNPRTVELAKSLPPRGAPSRGDLLWSVGYIIHCALLGLLMFCILPHAVELANSLALRASPHCVPSPRVLGTSSTACGLVNRRTFLHGLSFGYTDCRAR